MDAIEKVMIKALGDNQDVGFKVLWRMSGGNLDKARVIVKALLPHYSGSPAVLNASEKDFNFAFDCACASFNDDMEVEWAS